VLLFWVIVFVVAWTLLAGLVAWPLGRFLETRSRPMRGVELASEYHLIR
jgi:hypothetical protein